MKKSNFFDKKIYLCIKIGFNMGMKILTNAQIELLELFKQDLNEVELLELRRVLVAFKAQRAFQLLNQLWEKEGWSQQTMSEWATEHQRTPSF
jgi:hypothetical protein